VLRSPRALLALMATSALAGAFLASGCSEDTTEPAVAPHAVTLAAPVVVAPDSLRLSWSKNSDGDFAAYRLYVSQTSGTGTAGTLAATITSAADTSLVVGALSETTTYYFVVYVSDTEELSAASNEVSGTTSRTRPRWSWARRAE